MRTCNICGNQFSNNSKICTKCGCILPNYDIDVALSYKKHPLVIKPNFIKLWLISIVSFGLILALPSVIIEFYLGIICGLVCGVLFAGLMHIAMIILQRKFSILSSEISETKTIIVEGGATLDGVGGWLFITNEGVEFHNHKINFGKKSFAVTHANIQSIEKDGRCLVIISNNTKRKLIVENVNAWLAQIHCI